MFKTGDVLRVKEKISCFEEGDLVCVIAANQFRGCWQLELKWNNMMGAPTRGSFFFTEDEETVERIFNKEGERK